MQRRCKVINVMRMGGECQLIICNESIADPRLGNDDLRAFRVEFQFFAKLTHIHAQVFGVVCIGRVPNIRENALMGEYPSMIGGEIGE